MADSGKANMSPKAQKIAEMYLDFLAEEGYRPRIDDYGDVAFKCEGRSYVIEIDENDEDFFCLVYPHFWLIESDDELAQVEEAALAVTAESKVIKIWLLEDTNTWASIELFCSPPETFTAVFDCCLSALRIGVKKFVAKMEEPPEQDDAFVFHLPKYKVGEN